MVGNAHVPGSSKRRHMLSGSCLVSYEQLHFAFEVVRHGGENINTASCTPGFVTQNVKYVNIFCALAR